MLGPLLEVEMSKKCTPLWREAHFEVKMLKAPHARTTFWTFRCRFAWQVQGIAHLVSKVSKVWGLCSISKNDGRRRTYAEDLARCISRGRRSARDDFAWQVQHFVWSGINFSWQAQHFRRMEWKNCKSHWYEVVSSALYFPFVKEASQNSFVFDDVNFENWGSLAELSRFWRCQVQKLRKSRRIAAFSSLQVDKQTGRQTDR